MKNTFKLFGVIALLVIIGFSMAACSSGDGGASLAGTTWKYQGTMTMNGEPVTALTLNFIDGSTFRRVFVTASKTTTINGTYTFNGNSGTLHMPTWNPPDYTFTIDGNDLIVIGMGTYTKI